jgi:hypothetical protein
MDKYDFVHLVLWASQWELKSCLEILSRFPARERTAGKLIALFATSLVLVSYLFYSYTLKMGDTCSSETSVYFQRTAQSYIPEDRTFLEWINPWLQNIIKKHPTVQAPVKLIFMHLSIYPCIHTYTTYIHTYIHTYIYKQISRRTPVFIII